MSSDSLVKVVTIPALEKHPNADSLSIVTIEGSPIVVRTDDWREGDKAVLVPVDSLVPLRDPQFAFMSSGNKTIDGYAKVSARRFRGVYSEGLLVPTDEPVGKDVAELLDIRKYVSPQEQKALAVPKHNVERRLKPNEVRQLMVRSFLAAGVLALVAFAIVPPVFALGLSVLFLASALYTVAQAKLKGFVPNVPVYDIESRKKHSDALIPGERVVITEKLHGCNGKYIYTRGKLHIGSRTMFRKDPGNVWHQVANDYDLESKLKRHPDLVLFGEVYGKVQDLTYGLPDDVAFAAFDVMNLKTREYFSPDEFRAFCTELDIPMVPTLYQGEWKPELLALAEGQSTLADHVREGIVIKPMEERKVPGLGRCILKEIGEGYRLRNAA